MTEGFMYRGLFTKIINQLPASTTIVPFFRGEPLLHPHFVSMMNQLNRFSKVQLATNGDFLFKKDIRTAIMDNCTFFSLSLHECFLPSHTPYLRFFYEATGKLTTQVSILEKYLPQKHRKVFIESWRNHVDRVRIYKEHSRNGFGNMGTVTNQRCSKPFEEMVVFWNGQVGLCNHDWNGSYPLGDLNEMTIERVWNRVNYQGVRDLHESGLRRAVPTCEFCSFLNNKVYGKLVCTT